MSFPKKEEEFAADSRISYYEEDGKWILEDAHGEEWEWVRETGRWVPVVRCSLCPHFVNEFLADACPASR